MDQTNFRAHFFRFFEGSQKFCIDGQLLPRVNQWTLREIDASNDDANKEEIQLGRIYYFTKNARISFEKIKDLLIERSKLTILNEQDVLFLYTDASTNVIAGVLKFKTELRSQVSSCLMLIGTSINGELWSYSYMHLCSASSIYHPTCQEKNLS